MTTHRTGCPSKCILLAKPINAEKAILLKQAMYELYDDADNEYFMKKFT